MKKTRRETELKVIYLVDDEEFESIDEFTLDVSLIPAYTAERLAAATLKFTRNILSQPGGREMLAERTAKRNSLKESKKTREEGCAKNENQNRL